MAFQLGNDDNHGMSEMNLIPLIDIMLVLMIIFLVTATVLNPSIPLTLPKTSASAPQSVQPNVIDINIDKDNGIFFNQQPVTLLELESVLTKELTRTKKQKRTDNTVTVSMPSINIRADKDSNYDAIAKVLATASTVGLTDIAFVSDSLD